MATPQMTTTQTRRRRYRRVALWTIAIIMVGAMVLPLGSYVYTGIQSAHAQAVEDSNPRANYWRAVRGGDARQEFARIDVDEFEAEGMQHTVNWAEVAPLLFDGHRRRVDGGV